MTTRKEELRSVDWTVALQEADTPITWEYAREFRRQSEDVYEDSTAEALFQLLHVITGPRLEPESDEGPFPNMETLRDEELKDLSILLDEVEDPELLARIADTLWTQRGENYENAEVAIETYLQTALKLEGAYQNNRPALVRFERAFILSLLLGNEDKQEQVVDALESRIRDRADSETWWYSLNYSELLYHNQFGDPEEQARLMTNCADNIEEHFETAESLHADLDAAKDYLLLAAEWHEQAGDPESARRAKIQGAELLVQRAETAPTQMNTASWYRDALKLYRSIPGTDERTEEIHQLMLEAQGKMRDEMVQFSWDPSRPELQEEAREHLEGLSLQTALTRLAYSLSPPTLNEIEERAKEKAQEDPPKALVPEERMNEMGHTISNKPGGFEHEEEILDYLMHRVMSRVRTRVAVNFIRPARNQVVKDHYIRRQDLVEFARYSLFVADGRLLSISKGLYAGFRGDWVTVAHLLAPQLEAGLRHLLRQRGVITTGLDSQNIQEQKSLNRMLTEDSLRSPLEEMLGKNVVYDLEGLLTEASGANLRNLVAHGLSDDGRYWSPQVEYMWWTTLRLISHFSVREIDGSNTETQE